MYIFTAQIFLLEQVTEYTFTKPYLLAWRYRVYIYIYIYIYKLRVKFMLITFFK